MKVNKIIKEIYDKREKYIRMYHRFPKHLEISYKQMEWLLQFYICVTPIEDIKTLYGMEIVINNDIKRIKEINVY